jgi:hypothetical protein
MPAEQSALEVEIEKRIHALEAINANHAKAIATAQGIIRANRGEVSALARLLKSLKDVGDAVIDHVVVDDDAVREEPKCMVFANGLDANAHYFPCTMTTTSAVISVLSGRDDGLPLTEIAGLLRHEIHTRSHNPDKVIQNTVLNLQRRQVVERFVDRGTKRYRLSGRATDQPPNLLTVNGEG